MQETENSFNLVTCFITIDITDANAMKTSRNYDYLINAVYTSGDTKPNPNLHIVWGHERAGPVRINL